MSQTGNLINKINLYEFSAYLVPGTIFLFFINVGLNLYGFNTDIFRTNIVVDSIFAFVLFYFSGLLLHELSNLYQHYELLKIIGGFPSKQFLQKECRLICEDDKKICWRLAKKHLFLDINLRHNNKVELVSKISSYSQIIYEKFRESLKNDYANSDVINQAEVFNNHYGMYRTLITMSLCLIVYFGCISTLACITKSDSLIFSILLMLSFYFSSKILSVRLKRFANYHVKGIITQYISKNNNLNQPSLTIANSTR